MRGADYVIKRTGFAIATVLVAVTLNFLLFRTLPGNAVSGRVTVDPAMGCSMRITRSDSGGFSGFRARGIGIQSTTRSLA